MRYLLSALLLPALLPLALAQDNEAEKLFRDMEKRIKAAEAFQVTFAYQVEKRKAKGSLLLTSDNKARLKISGNFGDERNAAFELVADGKQLKSKGARLFVGSNGQSGVELGGQSEWETPKNFHAALSATVSRGGMWFSILVLPYLRGEAIDPDAEGSKMHAYDFTLGGAEKVGERDAKVVRYRFGKGGGCRDDEEMTLWLDAKTLLPLKRSFVLKRDDIRITETYSEFKLDPKIDAKAFELPAGKVYKSPAELFAGMPRNAFPKGGKDGTAQRQFARSWMDCRRGEQIEVSATIKDVSIKEDGKICTVDITLEGQQGNFMDELLERVTSAWYWEAAFAFRVEKCQTLLEPGSIRFGLEDSAMAKKFRDWQGKKATLRATINEGNFDIVRMGDAGPRLFCLLTVAYDSINGHALPPQKKPPENKGDPIGAKKK